MIRISLHRYTHFFKHKFLEKIFFCIAWFFQLNLICNFSFTWNLIKYISLLGIPRKYWGCVFIWFLTFKISVLCSLSVKASILILYWSIVYNSCILIKTVGVVALQQLIFHQHFWCSSEGLGDIIGLQWEVSNKIFEKHLSQIFGKSSSLDKKATFFYSLKVKWCYFSKKLLLP